MSMCCWATNYLKYSVNCIMAPTLIVICFFFVLCDCLPFTALTDWFFVMESVNVSCEVGYQVLNVHCVKYVLNRVNEKVFFFAFIVNHWRGESFSWPLHTSGRKMLVRFSVNFTNFILNIFYFYLFVIKLYYCGKLSRNKYHKLFWLRR